MGRAGTQQGSQDILHMFSTHSECFCFLNYSWKSVTSHPRGMLHHQQVKDVVRETFSLVALAVLSPA